MAAGSRGVRAFSPRPREAGASNGAYNVAMTETNVRDDVLLHRRLIWLAIALLCLPPIGWLGLELHRARRTGVVAAELERQGCVIKYGWGLTTVDVYRARLLDLLGAATPLPIGQINAQGSAITNADLVWVEGLNHLGVFNLTETHVTDAGLASLIALPNLFELVLNATDVTDAGMIHVAKIPHLYSLWLEGTQITDAGLVPLRGMKDLSELHLKGTSVTDAGVEELQKALPVLDIDR
jgi:hypothetical protein